MQYIMILMHNLIGVCFMYSLYTLYTVVTTKNIFFFTKCCPHGLKDLKNFLIGDWFRHEDDLGITGADSVQPCAEYFVIMFK